MFWGKKKKESCPSIINYGFGACLCVYSPPAHRQTLISSHPSRSRALTVKYERPFVYPPPSGFFVFLSSRNSDRRNLYFSKNHYIFLRQIGDSFVLSNPRARQYAFIVKSIIEGKSKGTEYTVDPRFSLVSTDITYNAPPKSIVRCLRGMIIWPCGSIVCP